MNEGQTSVEVVVLGQEDKSQKEETRLTEEKLIVLETAERVKPQDGENITYAKEILKQIQEEPLVDTPKNTQSVANQVNNDFSTKTLIRNIKNSFLYPSTDFVYSIVKVTAGLTLASFVAPYVSAPSQLTSSIEWGVLATGPLLAAEGYAYYLRNTTKIGDLLKYVKVASPKSKNLSDGTHISKGDLVGELHIEGTNAKKELLKMTERERGIAFGVQAAKDLTELAKMCRDNDVKVKDIKGFYGVSDVIRPHIMQRLGFSVKETQRSKYGLGNMALRLKRIQSLGLKGVSSNIGTIHEAWISREQLVARLAPKNSV